MEYYVGRQPSQKVTRTLKRVVAVLMRVGLDGLQTVLEKVKYCTRTIEG